MREEKTLVIIKPDAVKRKLVGEIIKTYESKGLVIEKMAFGLLDSEKLRAHYKEHKGKSFYSRLIEFMRSGPAIALLLSGMDAIETVRVLNGATNYLEASPGSIRGRFAYDMTENLVHGSDGVESASRELDIWFSNEASL